MQVFVFLGLILMNKVMKTKEYTKETPMAKLLKQWKIVKELLFEMKNEIIQKDARINELESVLKDVAAWKLPETGKFWDKEQKEPMSYSAAYGSDGVRNHFMKIATDVLIDK